MDKMDSFLREINGDKIRGAQATLAKDLGMSEAIVSKYITRERIPSKQTMKDMAKKYNKSEEEIKQIFEIQDTVDADKWTRIEKKLDLIIQMMKGTL